MKFAHSLRAIRISWISAILISTATLSLSSSSSSSDEKPRPCTIRSATTGKFFDLTPISITQQKSSSSKKDGDEPLASWHARGHDYPANFTLNFCAPVVEELKDVVGVDEDRWQNVSAFYEMGGKIYSIGEMQDQPVIRGSKLVLNYTNGSPCDSPESPSEPSGDGNDLKRRLALADEDDDDDNNNDDDTDKGNDSDDDDDNKDENGDPDDGDNERKHGKDNAGCARRKQTIISLLCDKDPLSAAKASVSFVAQTDHCTYVFEARSSAACGGIEVEKQSLGPAGVFGVIAMIAVIVYFVGGCVYQRTVMHQRGWRQVPNYALWAGIFGFFRDIFTILTSAFARFLPSRRGYSRVAITGNGRGRNSHSEDENRLIDQLDEEWDD